MHVCSLENVHVFAVERCLLVCVCVGKRTLFVVESCLLVRITDSSCVFLTIH